MLDRNLAKMYGVENRGLNQAVKRNIKRFPEDSMFQLNEEECLTSQIGISSLGDDRYRSFVCTEQGIVILFSVLRIPLVIRQILRLPCFYMLCNGQIREQKRIKCPSRNSYIGLRFKL